MEITGSKGIDQGDIFKRLVDAGQANKEKETEEFARAFVAGGEWLARQKDPFGQFKHIVATALTIDAMKLEDAHRQFERVFDPKVGGEGATKGFDLLVGLAMLKADPEQFNNTLTEAMLANLRRQREREERIKKIFEPIKPKGGIHDNIFNPFGTKDEDNKTPDDFWPKNKKYISDNFPENKIDGWEEKFLKKPTGKIIDPLKNENKVGKPNEIENPWEKFIKDDLLKNKEYWGKYFDKKPLNNTDLDPEPIDK